MKQASEQPNNLMVFSACSGIGSAFIKQLEAEGFGGLKIGFSRSRCPTTEQTLDLFFDWDIQSLEKLERDLKQLTLTDKPIWVLIATGWLHDDSMMPEKSYRQLNIEQLQHAFLINTIAPALITQLVLNRFKHEIPIRLGILSARVGSISDNRMGGWHSYRASKAALNMLIKNYAIELMRSSKNAVEIFGIQPGTTATDLSKPFTQNISKDQLQSPAYTATQLIDLFQHFQPEWNGQMVDFEGHVIQP